MNRNQKLKALMTGCALILAAAVILAVSGVFGGIGYSYVNAEKYTGGGAEIREAVRNLEIHWTDGAVRVEYHDADTVLLHETSEKTISEDMRLRWWLDGDTLKVQYAKPGLHLFTDLDKVLTVTLPEGAALGRVSAEATSGDLDIPSIKADEVKLGTTSGEIRAGAEAGSLHADTTSGNQDLRTTGTVNEIRMESTSGSVALEAENIGKMEAKSTSGGVSVTVSGKADTMRVKSTSGRIAAEVNEATELTAESTSGDADVRAANAGEIRITSTSGKVRVGAGKMQKLSVATTSGDVTAALAQDPGFTAKVRTSSGGVSNTVALTASGDEYSCGDGSGKAEISTTSGNIRIEAWQE